MLEDADSVPAKQETPPFTYVLKTVMKEADRLAIDYPQMIQSNDLPKQKRINTIIEGKALRYLDGYTDAEKQNMEWDIDTKVHFEGERMLSITFSGYISSPDWAHPGKIFDVLNIDLKEERIVKLSELLLLDERLAQIIRTKQVADEGEGEAKNQSDEQLLEQLRAQQSDNFYFDEQSLTLVFDTFYAIGSYVWLEFEHSELKSQRAVGEPKWNKLMKQKQDDGKVLDFLRKQVPEIQQFAKQLSENGAESKLTMYVESYPDYQAKEAWYIVYVGESRSQSNVLWNRFAVSAALKEVKVYDAVNNTYAELEKWRRSNFDDARKR
jgi:hypothetical protein